VIWSILLQSKQLPVAILILLHLLWVDGIEKK